MIRITLKIPRGGVIDVGVPVIVGVDPNDPVFLPAATILDLQIGKTFGFAGSQGVNVSFDVFNVFNSDVVTNADYQYSPGLATAIVPSRRFRLGIGYQF